VASNYTGNQGSTQAPSGPPTPDGNPVASIPVDGDPVNAASVAQGFKMAADWLAWLTKPKAIATSWVQAIRRYRSAVGHTRAVIDHLGFLNGRVVSWDEPWPWAVGGSLELGGGSATLGPVGIHGRTVAWDAQNNSRISSLYLGLLAASTGTALADVKAGLGDAAAAIHFLALDPTPASGPWLAKMTQAVNAVGTSSVTFAAPDGTATKPHRMVQLEAADSATDYAMLYRKAELTFSDDLTFALEWEIYVAAVGIPNRIVMVGVCEEELLPFTSSAQNFAVFELDPTGNWFASCAGGGVNAGFDTTIPPTVGWTRFRIEFHGANVADNGTRALRYYINGALVATMTAHLPATTAAGGVHMSIYNPSGGASGVAHPLRVGPMRFRSNIYAADVV
jgi:hypothetical protein